MHFLQELADGCNFLSGAASRKNIDAKPTSSTDDVRFTRSALSPRVEFVLPPSSPAAACKYTSSTSLAVSSTMA